MEYYYDFLQTELYGLPAASLNSAKKLQCYAFHYNCAYVFHYLPCSLKPCGDFKISPEEGAEKLCDPGL